MSNSKKTIKVKNEFSNVYGDGKDLNIGKNKTVNELLKNIPNSNLNNINQNTNTSDYDLERKETLRVPTLSSEQKVISSPFKMIYIAIIVILLLLLSLLFIYKDYFINK